MIKNKHNAELQRTAPASKDKGLFSTKKHLNICVINRIYISFSREATMIYRNSFLYSSWAGEWNGFKM